MDLLIYVEHKNGRVKRTALEATSKAAEIASAGDGQVSAVLLGAGAGSAASGLANYGVDRLLVCENGVFDDYLVDPHVELLGQITESNKFAAIVFPDTADSRDIAARLAARLKGSIVSGVVDLEVAGGNLTARETIFGGNYVTSVDMRNSSCAVVLARPNAFEVKAAQRDLQTEMLEYTPSEGTARVRIVSTAEEAGAPVPLEEAPIIVAGGRGLGGPEPFSLLQELADALGGVVGASRAAVDAGWISYSHQIGQTGRTVKPSLYIAVGISGAVQHRVGMQTADTIIAINRDADSPIFALSDLAVVGNLFEVIPALTAEIKRRKGA